MTDTSMPILHLPKRGPRSQASPEWERERHAAEAAYWADHLNEFEQRLPRMRANRGDARAGRLVRDVLGELAATHGEDIARDARERLMGRWREQAGAGRGGS